MSNQNFEIKRRFDFQRDGFTRDLFLDKTREHILNKNTDVNIYPVNAYIWFHDILPHVFNYTVETFSHTWIKQTILQRNFEDRSYTYKGSQVNKLWQTYSQDKNLFFMFTKIYKFMQNIPREFIVPISLGAVPTEIRKPSGDTMPGWDYRFHPGGTKLRCLSFMPSNLNFNIMITHSPNTHHLQNYFKEKSIEYYSFVNSSNNELKRLLNLDKFYDNAYILYNQEVGFQIMESDEEADSELGLEWHVELRNKCVYVNNYKIINWNKFDQMFEFVNERKNLNDTRCPRDNIHCPLHKTQ